MDRADSRFWLIITPLINSASRLAWSNMAYCRACDRHFESSHSLGQHLGSRHARTYCGRCDRHFAHEQARWQHINNSSQHHLCPECASINDFGSQQDLDRHRERFHDMCVRCEWRFDDEDELEEHQVEEHNKCVTCGDEFMSPSNLRYHRITHAARDVECFGCDRRFKSTSAMVLHLEAGTCESQADASLVDEVAMDRYASYGYQFESTHAGYDFACPTCDAPFKWMSGLLQHAESDACDEDVDRGYLDDFLRALSRRV